MKKWIYVAECLYRKCAGGKIYIRIQQSGKRVMRSTKTDKPVRAGTILKRMRDEAWAEKYNAVLPGPQVRERMLTVKLLIADYVQAGHPTKKMRTKDPDTIRRGINLLTPVLEWWGDKNPSAITLADCDAYRQWRNSGGFVSHFTIRGHPQKRDTVGGDRSVDMELDCLSNVFNLARRRTKIKANPVDWPWQVCRRFRHTPLP